MTPNPLLPLAVALVAGASASAVQRRLRPRLAAWSLTLVAAGSAAATIWAALMLAVGVTAQSPPLARLAGWCRDMYRADDHVVPAVGIAAIVVLLISGWRCVRVLRQHRSDLRAAAALALRAEQDELLSIYASAEPFAYALPSRPRRILVSTGMLAALDCDQREAMQAHELSHLRHRHHRFVLVAELAAAAIPVLRPVAEQVRFATERWADEDAATAIGSRTLVAQAVAQAALVSSDYSRTALALGNWGVAARVTALLSPNSPQPIAPVMGFSISGLIVTGNLIGSTVQLHHLIEFAAHVCNAG